MSSRRLLRRRLRVWAIACSGLVVAIGSMPAAAYQRPGRTERVSVASDGTEGRSGSGTPSISADGRYVAFDSRASNLVPNDTNGERDIFVHDRETGATKRVSVASDGTEGNGHSGSPSISADGRYIAFESLTSNLVPGDTNQNWDIFVHDRETGTTKRVSITSDGSEGNGLSVRPSISADGRYVAFESRASNLVSGDTNGIEDIFVHDRETGTTERVSVADDGTEGNDWSGFPSISGNGRYVAFESLASNLVPGDTNDTDDVFVHDRETGVTERVSVASDGTQGNNFSVRPSITPDGRYVAFHSLASNLVPRDTNERTDVFVRDRETGITERVSVGSDGAEAHDADFLPAITEAASISADGRFVAFHSWASTLVPDDTNGTYDVFVHDREIGATERVSVASDGSQAKGHSQMPSVSADGRFVAFHSSAASNNLVPGDTNGAQDVFVRDRGPAVGVGDLAPVLDGGEITVSGWATFSGMVASASDSTDDSTPGVAMVGGELTAASVVSRWEAEDLLFRWEVARFSEPGGGSPGIIYGFQFEHAGERYEVRAVLTETASPPLPVPNFGLYRCDPECTRLASLSGGIGTAGNDVRVALPLEVLGAEPGGALAELRAYTALGEAGPGPLVTLDEVELADAVIPPAQVSLGIAPTGTPASGVAFDTDAPFVEGDFSGVLGISALTPGDYDVWARACLDETCGVASRPVLIEGEPVAEIKDTILELTVEGRGQNMQLHARLAELDSPSNVIAGRTIDFYSDGERIGSEATNGDGIATIPIPPGHRGANRTYGAVFEGDDFYGASSDSRPGRGRGESDGTARHEARSDGGAVLIR